MTSLPRRVSAQRDGDRWILAPQDWTTCLEVLQSGGLVVYPTETLYGLGADPYNDASVARLYAAKRRPRTAPFSLAVASLEEARGLADFSETALKIWKAYMPGPLTVILRATPAAPPAVLSPTGTVGLRMPRHVLALELTQTFGPLTATSANPHGGPPPRTVEEAEAGLQEGVDLYLDAGPCPVGEASTIVDLSEGRITIKREGAVGREELSAYGG